MSTFEAISDERLVFEIIRRMMNVDGILAETDVPYSRFIETLRHIIKNDGSIKQALQNLISNDSILLYGRAIKHSWSKGELKNEELQLADVSKLDITQCSTYFSLSGRQLAQWEITDHQTRPSTHMETKIEKIVLPS